MQIEIRGIVAEVCRLAPGDLELAVDGCSVPTFGAPARAFATAYAALAAPDDIAESAGGRHEAALERLRAGMTAYPDNVGGTPALHEAILTRHSPEVRNHNDIHVGDLRAAFTLTTRVAM